MKLPIGKLALMLMLTLVPFRAVRAHGGGGMGFGGGAGHSDFSAHGPTEAGSTEKNLPDDDPLDFWPFNTLGHRNDKSAAVEKRRSALRLEAARARQEGHPAEKVLELDRRLRRTEVEYEIARKREERDTMRRDGRRDQAESLDREIHLLKRKLEP